MNKIKVLSGVPRGVHLNLEHATRSLEFCNFTYMCIKLPNGGLKIPENLKAVLMPVLANLQHFTDVQADDYVYATVSRKHVQPFTHGNREGWHIDGFLSDDKSYIWCDTLPTEVAVGEFSLTPDHEVSLQEMKDQVVFSMPMQTGVLYELGDVVHAPTRNNTPDVVLRTFIKIVISKERFNGLGNAWNYKLPSFVPTNARSTHRNHTVV